MRICIPTLDGEGRSAKVSGHFGSAPYFTIYDTDTDSFEVLNNQNEHHQHGMCHPLASLAGKNLNAVACGGMGARALEGLNAGGIRAFRVSAGTVDEVITRYRRGELEEMTLENSCRQHDCH
jgi:predicted Fe-Mo cluster-binding NifX family protein